MPAAIFLSYARADDEPFVRRLHGDLTQAGFDVWLDRDDMRARGLTFIHEVKHAISERDRLVFIVGPAAVASPYLRMEWEHALASDKCVNPIVRLDGRKPDGSVLDGYGLMPEELAFLHAEDFRDDAHYATHLANLIRQLSDAPPPLGKLIAVPSMDAVAPHLIRQSDRLRALRDALLSDLQSKPVGITGEQPRVGLHGMGGIGKSVLACVLAHDRQVRQSYPDGIFWLPFGQQPNLVQLQRNVAKALGDEGAFENDAQGRAKLRELLLGKAVLLICDDVWEAHHTTAFDVLGPRCRALITTRDAGLLQALHAQEFRVQLLTDDEALALLARAAGTDRAALPAEAREVARECDHLPLALALCGGMAFGPEGIGWADILGALRNADLADIATDHPLAEQHASLWKAISLSVQQLKPEEQRRWAELSVFPEDETVPEAAVRTLWTHTGAMSSIAIGNLLKRLASRSLLYLDPVKGGDTVHRLHRVSLHDLLHDYAKRRAGDRPALHRQMLDAYAAQCPAGWPSGPDDGWFLQHLRDHLCAAERTDEFASLLLELRWLERKNEAGLTFDLAEDFTAAVDTLPQGHVERQRLRLLDEALRRDIHFIARHTKDYPQALFQSLWNSAGWYDCPDVEKHYAGADRHWNHFGEKLCDLLQKWRTQKEQQNPEFCWLRSLRAPVNPIGTARRAVLRGHEAPVSCLDFSRDGRKLVTGSQDHTIRVWDLGTSRQIHCLREHSSGVVGVSYSPDGTQVSFSPDGTRIVSAGGDRTVRVWDVRTGSQLNCLLGHDAWITTVTYSPDGLKIASGSKDKTIIIWDALSGQRLFCLRHQAEILSVAYSPDGRRILSASKDGTLLIWNSESGERVFSIHHGPYLRCAIFSPNGREVVSASWKSIQFWDSQTAETRRAFKTDKTALVDCLSYSPDGHQIIAGARGIAQQVSATLHVLDISTGRELCVVHGIQNPIWSVAYSPNGALIATAAGGYGEDLGAVWLWDATLIADVPILKGHAAMIRGISFSDDGKRIATDAHDKTIREWDCLSGIEIRCYHREERRHFLGDEFTRAIETQGILEAKTSITFGADYAGHPGHETVVQSTTLPRPFMWLPIAFEHIGLHPSGRILAGSAYSHLYVFSLEGRLAITGRTPGKGNNS